VGVYIVFFKNQEEPEAPTINALNKTSCGCKQARKEREKEQKQKQKEEARKGTKGQQKCGRRSTRLQIGIDP